MFRLLLTLGLSSAVPVAFHKHYSCQGGANANSAKLCVQAGPGENTHGQLTLPSCRLACGLSNLPLWPMPMSVKGAETNEILKISDLSLIILYNTSASDVSTLLTSSFEEFKKDLHLPQDASGLPMVQVKVNVETDVSQLLMDTDESYSMQVEFRCVTTRQRAYQTPNYLRVRTCHV